jgi:hypothetical protein
MKDRCQRIAEVPVEPTSLPLRAALDALDVQIRKIHEEAALAA